MTTTLLLGTNVFRETKENTLDALSKYSFDPSYVDYKRDNEKPSRNDTPKNLEMVEARIASLRNPMIV
jgi:hypothetical protein